MQVDAFKTGDMAALGEAVDRCLPRIWRLVGRGFLASIDGVPVYVRGLTDLDTREHEVELIVASCLQPESRETIDGPSALDRALLKAVRTTMLQHAERSGDLADVATDEARADVPEQVEDLDRLIAEGAAPSDAELPMDAGREQEAEALLAIRDEYVADLDERSRALVELRFVGGESRASCAKSFDCGIAAVTEREHRVRRKLSHAIRRVHPTRTPKAASLDALLAQRALEALPPPVTVDRLRKNILSRVHQEAARPFGVRAAWAGAVAAIAFVLWLLMFLRILPYYDDDTFPTPSVAIECAADCSVSVLAPQDAQQVAIAQLDADGVAMPLLLGPGGGTISLPFGARQKAVPIPYRAEKPKAGTVVAVFSDRRLTKKEVLGAAEQRLAIDGVLTASTAVGGS